MRNKGDRDRERIRKIQNHLSYNALDAFLVLTKINRQYLSGFTGSVGVLLIDENKAALYVDDRYLIRARTESWVPIYPLSNLPLINPDGTVGVKGEKVGVEDQISLREFAKLKKDYHGVKWVVMHDVVENLRAVKSSEEIRQIKKAQNIIDKIFSAAKKLAMVAMTEGVMAQELERLAIKYGARGMAFEPIVAFGVNAAAPHHLSGGQKMKNNNFLLLDFGVKIGDYHSDFTRTLFIGQPNKKQEKVYNTVFEAQIKGIGEIREGVEAKKVDSVVRRFIGQAGFGKFFTHNTGHGVGLETHELPNLAADSADILQSRMIVTIEPGIYIKNWGGVRIEDMVVVGKNGAIVMSTIPRDLKSMIINP